jgi:hypothetical protein
MHHHGLSDPNRHPDDPGPGYGPAELESLLKESFGGEFWRVWHEDSSRVPGAQLYAGFTEAPSGRLVLSGLVLLGEALTADMLRKVPVAALENSANIARQQEGRAEVDRLPPLKRDPSLSAEDFSRLVADHYRAWARIVTHPAAAMAADADVKVPTVHSWIREARLRGHLESGRRGKRS